MSRPTRKRLTRKLIAQLSDRIKAGAFELVAAESLGVSADLLNYWRGLGLKKHPPRPIYREMVDALRGAGAHARFMAEMEMRREQPRFWLLHGPGKETATTPGWTAPVRAPAPKDDAAHQDQPSLDDILQTVLDALKHFPDAHRKVLDSLNHKKLPEAEDGDEETGPE